LHQTLIIVAVPPSAIANRPKKLMAPKSGAGVMLSQNPFSLSTRASGALPAMIAALIDPIEIPATQS